VGHGAPGRPGPRPGGDVSDAPAGRRGEVRLGLSLALGGLVIVLDTTITVVAVPELIRVFDAPLATAQWTTTAYLLALVTTMPLGAWLSTRVGARRAYVAALIGFAAASAWAGMAHGIGELIAARVVQGLAGGVINPVGFALALRHVPSERRGRMTALLGLPVLVGPLLGPVAAGWLIDAWSWRAIFFVTVAPALLGALLVLRWAPRDPATQRAPLDVGGLLLLVPGAVAMVYGIGAADAATPVRVTAVVVGAALGTAFVARSLHHPTPLLRVRLLADPMFAGAAALLTLFAAGYFGSMLLMPAYVQITRGDPAVVAGSLMIPGALATGLSLQVATRLVDRVSPRLVVGTGLTVVLTAVTLTLLVLRTDTSYVVLGALAALTGAGAGAVIMPTMTTAARHLHGADLASASAILTLLSQLASAAGTAGVTALFAGMIAWRSAASDLDEVTGMTAAARLDLAPDLVTAQRLTQLATLFVFAGALWLALRYLGRGTPPTPSVEPIPDQEEARP
jgi:EmrB/QacA subfamily drug resistance transporter